VGAGDLSRLISDLLAGRLTQGAPVVHFVFLLQEVFRQDGSIPVNLPPRAKSGREIRPLPSGRKRLDIIKAAERFGLWLFYIPSIRNGPSDRLPEDRGNAILSSIPLSSPTAIELPFDRQRKVSIAVQVSGETGTGKPWEIQIINVHLENRATWRHIFQSFGRLRLNQVTGLLMVLPLDTAAIMGGDFNTWYRESKEPAIRHIRSRFRFPHSEEKIKTFRPGFLLPERRLDYLFFRLPDHWKGSYRRIEERYGSDHYPLLGRVSVR
jgi:hypothetical protein